MFLEGIKVFLFTVDIILITYFQTDACSTKVGFMIIDTLNFLLCVAKKKTDLFMEDHISQGNTCQDVRSVNLHIIGTIESQI